MFAKEISARLDELSGDQDFLQSVSDIKAGKFPRDTNNPHYRQRMIYTKALRDFVYNPAWLNVILLDEDLKCRFLRLFGYVGNTSFTMYPSAWIRDLPLLDFGEGVYLGDDILLGSNQLSLDQKFITVGKITIGVRSIFDQKCSIGLNSEIGPDCSFGFRTSIGLKCSIGSKVRVRETTNIGHKVTIGDNVTIGQCCNILDFTVVEAGTSIPPHSQIPAFSYVSPEGISSKKNMGTKTKK